MIKIKKNLVLVSLAQLVGTIHKICKVLGSNLSHYQKKYLIYTQTNIKRILQFFEEAKLTHPNWHLRESNLRPWGWPRSQVPSQYHQANPSGLRILQLYPIVCWHFILFNRYDKSYDFNLFNYVTMYIYASYKFNLFNYVKQFFYIYVSYKFFDRFFLGIFFYRY